MRKALAFAVVLLAFQASAGTITSINPSSIQTRSGEYFLTVNGSGFALGDVIIYEGYNGRFEIESTSIDSVGNITGWVPAQVVNSPDVYSVSVRSGLQTSGAVSLSVYKPGRAPLRIHVPELLVASARSKLGVGIKYEVTATGGDGVYSFSCDPPSGSTFPFGLSYISCVVKDGLGGYEEDRIRVNVADMTKPSITVPTSFEVKAELKEGAYVQFSTSGFDDIDGELKPVCSRESGSLFPNGRSIVDCEVADLSLNPAYGSFEVFVHPLDPGVLKIEVPLDMKVPAQDKDGAHVEYTVRPYGSADPDPVVTCTPESNSFFRVGYSKVSCLATDDFGQRAENGFTIYVDQFVGLTMDDVAAEATSPSGAEVTWNQPEKWTANVTCSPASGSLFGFGETAVDCESQDSEGRPAVARFHVTVKDTVAPHINRVDVAAGAYDATREATPVSVTVDAIDAADLAPRCTVAALTSDAAGTASWKATGDLSFDVRDAGSYRVQVSCVDASGNRSTETVPLAIAGSARRREKNH